MARTLVLILMFTFAGISVDAQCDFNCVSGGGCIPNSKYCDFNLDCADGSDEADCPSVCDFEDGMCGWTQNTDDNYDWRVRNSASSTPPGFLGPSEDHTSNSLSGTYLYVDGVYTNVSSNTRLTSPTFKKAARTCKIAVWHHFFGGEYGDLEISQVTQGGRKHLLKVADDVGSFLKWFYSEVYVDPCLENFQIIIEAQDRQKVPIEGGIAIDDISFIDCGIDTSTVSCPTAYSQCLSGYCYHSDYQCDFTTDCCGELTDESSCGDYKMCDFENGWCDFTQLTDDVFDWRRHQGSTSSDSTGPDADHTTGTAQGYYIYTDVSRPVRPNDYASIASYVIAGNPTNCKVKFWYHMKGDFIGRLDVGTRESINGPFHRIWDQREDQRDPWMFKALEIARENDFQVVFKSTRGLTAYGDISLDDISFTPGCVAAGRNLPVHTTQKPPFTLPGGECGATQYQCENGQCVRGDAFCDFNYDCDDGSDEITCPVGCSFEYDLCYWTQDPDDDGNWKIRTAQTDMDLDFNGPVDDHTTGGGRGKYLYVEAGPLPAQGAKTRLISPVFRQASRACRFTLWFYMFGAEYGDIEIFVKTSSGERKLRKIVEDLPHYNKWLREEADIDACTENFQIVVQAEDEQIIPANSGFAIDDFLFLDCGAPIPVAGGPCGLREAQCANGVCYPADQQCDFSLDCCDGTDELPSHCLNYNMCDFETDFCDWQNLNDDEFDWQRDKGGTSSGNTGPGRDHTTKSSSGYYLYTEVDRPIRNGDRARLGSFTIYATITQLCSMRFYYHLNGNGIGTLNIYSRQAVNGPLDKVWSLDTQRGDTWYYGSVTFAIQNVAFQVIIEGVRGPTQEGDMAIDDISFSTGCGQSPGPLPVVSTTAYTGSTRPPAPPCNSKQWLCPFEYTCIPKSKRCNDVEDCMDGSDEDDCDDSGNGDDTNALAIAMGVIFGTLFLVIVIGGAIFFMKNRTKSIPPSNTSSPGVENPSYKSSEKIVSET
ncbi:MAM and LDL-receptor class A domain-containing protein 1 [Holothuria leucospilota]|uniref:MAM and LDL-receptor class A domain-containing protein 1 n=1 Tax=Holothuria leucospilota TaxID=206669 RepID=A0A9Q1HFS1_HOLLE|nr:MAM and LDL-receptor class A domain-containing protein 1 [Holothuria leucospilota]